MKELKGMHQLSVSIRLLKEYAFCSLGSSLDTQTGWMQKFKLRALAKTAVISTMMTICLLPFARKERTFLLSVIYHTVVAATVVADLLFARKLRVLSTSISSRLDEENSFSSSDKSIKNSK
jgi:hypothetical protein